MNGRKEGMNFRRAGTRRDENRVHALDYSRFIRLASLQSVAPFVTEAVRMLACSILVLQSPEAKFTPSTKYESHHTRTQIRAQ